jgi:hypothetical protein
MPISIVETFQESWCNESNTSFLWPAVWNSILGFHSKITLKCINPRKSARMSIDKAIRHWLAPKQSKTGIRHIWLVSSRIFYQNGETNCTQLHSIALNCTCIIIGTSKIFKVQNGLFSWAAAPWQDKDPRVVQLAQEVKSWARKEVPATCHRKFNFQHGNQRDNLDMSLWAVVFGHCLSFAPNIHPRCILEASFCPRVLE